MNKRQANLLLILVVLVIALVQPIWRMAEGFDVVTLGLDLKGGVSVVLQATPPMGQEVKPDDMSGLVEVIRNRVDPQGQKEVVITVVGNDRVVQVPGEKDPNAVLQLIGKTALLEFVHAGKDALEEGASIEGLNLPVVVTGRDLADAYPTRDQMGRPAVGFEFKADAADTFGKFTKNHVKEYLAIALDGVVISCPVINGPIWGGRGIIEGGGFNVENATLLARQIKGGALPIPVQELESRVVGPSLGQESIDASVVAGIGGFIVILLFMILLYRLPGFVSNLALALYVVLLVGYLSLFNVTLTLPGIAGIILSIGMAIDANIIIFERLKEELAWGKTLGAAMEAAFARAWIAILDGNLTTLIAALILFFFGTGPVKGFAITLSLGILISMFSAVFVTRFILEFVTMRFKKLGLYA
jgi:preprotein translocase subunit SecD